MRHRSECALRSDVPDPKKPTIMHSLGAFFGHVWKGVKTDPAQKPVATRTKVEEEVRDTPAGRVVLRRTTIEEVELRPDQVPPPGA